MTTFIMLLMMLVLIIMMTCVKIVSTDEVYIIERLGKYHATWGSGVHFKMPFIDRVAKRLVSSNIIIEMMCTDMETYDHTFINLRVSVVLKIFDYQKYAYSQAQNQFENLIHDELSAIILKCPAEKIEELLKKIEYKLSKRVEESSIMKNIGLNCLELSLSKD